MPKDKREKHDIKDRQKEQERIKRLLSAKDEVPVGSRGKKSPITTAIQYFKNQQSHRLYPLLSTALSVVFGMLISPVIGAICAVITLYLIIVIFIPWRSLVKENNVIVVRYGLSLFLCLVVAFPYWGKIVSIFPDNHVKEIVIQQNANEMPTFVDGLQTINFSFGRINTTRTVSQLVTEPQQPFTWDSYHPITLYIDNGKLYADATLLNTNNLSSVVIKHNVIIDRPQGWKMQSSDSLLEIVDENNNPVFQLIYDTPYHIVINGIFAFPSGGGYLANYDGDSYLFNTTPPQNFKLKRLFIYP